MKVAITEITLEPSLSSERGHISHMEQRREGGVGVREGQGTLQSKAFCIYFNEHDVTCGHNAAHFSS